MFSEASLCLTVTDSICRDTANYHLLMKTNLVSHSLKYLTQTYLGYEIQSGSHDLYVDCVSVMRLYKRFSALDHEREGIGHQLLLESFESLKTPKLEEMVVNDLYEISTPKYRCWRLDLVQT
ncbi:hypothetical protein TB2_014167 [Malus domestica]